jgi:hypothetical protein
VTYTQRTNGTDVGKALTEDMQHLQGKLNTGGCKKRVGKRQKTMYRKQDIVWKPRSLMKFILILF